MGTEMMEEEVNERPELPDAVKKRPPTIDQYIIEKFNLDPRWQQCCWKKEGMNSKTGECKFILVDGAVYSRTISRGPRKGEVNYKKPEPGTSMSVSVIPDEMNAWLAKWERETGYCQECKGTGFSVHGWSQDRGMRYRKCKDCGATGKIAP